MEIEATTKKWGNSLGVILPKDLVKKEHIKENQKIHILILSNDNTVKKTFGLLKGKFKKSTQKLKEEMKRDLHSS